MIRMVQCRSAVQAKDYHKSALSTGNYFINDQEMAGRFYGRIAERLGIAGPISKDAYNALCENIHPRTGRLLTARKLFNRTIGYDINFHCPKSLSILIALIDDEHLLNAFRQSVLETMLHIENDAKVRVRDKKQDHDRPSDGLIWAEFIHFTARPVDGSAPDPHTHAHCMTFNISSDPVSEKLKAVQFRYIKQDMPYYQARFHFHLAQKLMELGYQIRRTRTAFEIEGVPENVIDIFAKRTNAIGQYIEDHNITDAKEKDEVGARTRLKKNKNLNMTQLKKEWRRQIHSLGMTDKTAGGKAIRYATDRKIHAVTAQECVEFAVLNKFERASVVHDRRLLETAFRHALGKAGVTIEDITRQFQQDKRILQIEDGGKRMCTTRQVLAEERRMVSLAQKGIGAMVPLYAAVPSLALAGQQATAAGHVLTTKDRISIISGKAGTGKTTMLKEIVRLIEDIGIEVTAVAPTSNASRGTLRAEGFDKAETVAKLLASPELQAKLRNGVLLVDEAGLLGTKAMLALIEMVTRQNARLILCGDASQMSAVERGDSLRILMTVAGIQPAVVSKIHRQKRQTYREAVQALSQGDIKTGFSKLEAIEAIHDINPDDPYAELASTYVATVKKGKTALAVCPTHAQGHEVTKAIRQKLREHKLLGRTETPVLSLVNLSMTEAEKSDLRNYQPGYVLHINKSRMGIRRGSRWTVSAVMDQGLLVTDGSGNQVALPVDKGEAFEVYRKTEIPLAKGDMIRVSRNGEDVTRKRLNNGQLLKVTGFNKKGQIITSSLAGKAQYRLDPQFGYLAYAHCITSHASQGQTVDEVFVAQPASTFPATDLKQFYVSVSRGREKIHIFTDDRSGLLAHVSEAGNRQSALELMQKQSRQFPAFSLMPILQRQPDAAPLPPPAAPVRSPSPKRKHEVKPVPA